MLSKLFSKSKPRKFSFKSSSFSSQSQQQPKLQQQPNSNNSNNPIGTKFRTKCLNIPKQFPILSQSTFYTTHIEVLMQTPSISSLFQQKILQMKKQFHQNTVYQKYLASIMVNIMQQDGIFYIFVKLWVNFCGFQFKKIIQDKDKDNNTGEQKQLKQDVQLKSKQQKRKRDLQKQQKITQFFHKQFFLLCYFIFQIVLYLFKSEFANLKQGISQRQLYKLIRNTITSTKKWSQIHYTFRKHIKCQTNKTSFTEEQVQQNMKQLQKICKISKIPIPFMDSINIMKEFVSMAEVEEKLKKCVELVSAVKREMMEYRVINDMEKQKQKQKESKTQTQPSNITPTPSSSSISKSTHIFCADDILSALTYVMWRLNKNLYGPCIYTQIILCSQYETMQYQYLAKELDLFGDNVRHAFDTLRSVARIQLLGEEVMNNIN